MLESLSIIPTIQYTVAEAVKQLYGIHLVPSDILVEHPENTEWGDYATNISMVIAKDVKQSPITIAKELGYKMYDIFDHSTEESHLSGIFKSIDYAKPGFINLTLSSEWLINVLGIINSQDESYGSLKNLEKKRIALEHSNVNPNKAAHVGHLRNSAIGQFIERVYEHLGYDVEVQYYANDLGLQVATSSLGIKKLASISPDNYKKYDHYAWDVYTEISSMLAQDPQLKVELDETMKKIEDPHSPESQLQMQIADKILKAQLETFHNLDIDYDVIVHERDIIFMKFWEAAFEQMKTSDNVYMSKEGKSKGCWLVRLSDNNKNPNKLGNSDIEEDKIIVRSNGVPTYTGKDIAYHMWKFGLLDRDFYYSKVSDSYQAKDLWETTYIPNEVKDITFSDVDMVFDVIDVKQTYAIDVVKQSLRFMGYEKEAESMLHINYGFVYLSASTAGELGIKVEDDKVQVGMSGRKGWGVKIDDFIELIDQQLVKEHGNFPALKHVRNGAIKFEMLRHNTFQDMVFDLNEALNIKGYTGPYVQYAHARACSVLEKGAYSFSNDYKQHMMESFDTSQLVSKEMDLLRTLYKFAEVVSESAEMFSPNTMCLYLFDLSQKFNAFYNDVPILSAETDYQREFRLMLTNSVKIVLRNGLYLLGITAPEKM